MTFQISATRDGSLIVAIATVCTLSAIALILAVVAVIGAVVRHADWALQAVRWLNPHV